ncbi:FAD synthetase [Thraustotheca clavata]|uniref:FAD synthase n=1 Tax=Thraustotheca clavata TaxID=74557 RepID=A0A1V9ZQG3_9STRA|nr:FAD synthetase [Thraustotheca clavata]
MDELVSRFDALCDKVDEETRRVFVHSIEILDRSIDILGLEKICFSFNGGKDSTVVLHLLRLVIAKRVLNTIKQNGQLVQDFNELYYQMLQKMPVLYFHTTDQFPQVNDFIHACITKYHLQCGVQACSFIEGIQNIITQRGVQAFTMGVRKGDPFTEDLEHFAPSSKGWPAFFRINPILHWRYDHVWLFLRELNLEYCCLYDEGYTSLGSIHNTVRNPELRIKDALGHESYLPAYRLKDGSSERCGRGRWDKSALFYLIPFRQPCAMSAMALPLPSDYFKCPPLPQHEKDQLIAFGQKICKDVVLNAMAMQLAPVEAVLTNPKTKRRARMRRGKDVFNQELDGMCSYTQVQSTLGQVADFFYLDTSVKLRAYGSVVGQMVLDRQTLHTLVDHPDWTSQGNQYSPLHYIGIEWMVMECPFLVSNRDTCFIEAHDEFEFFDEKSKTPRRGFVRAVHSIEMEACPSLRETHGIVRSSLVRSGHIFIETDDPMVLDYVCVYVTNPNGKVPRMINLKMLYHQCARVLNLEQYLHLDRITFAFDNGEFTHVSAFQDKRLVNFCSRCDKKFNLFNRKAHCRKCGQVVCHSCSFRWQLQFRRSSNIKVRLCNYCFTGGMDFRPLPHSSVALSTFDDQTLNATSTVSELSVESSSVHEEAEVVEEEEATHVIEDEFDTDYLNEHPVMEGMFSFHSSSRSLHFSKSSFSPYCDDSSLVVSM